MIPTSLLLHIDLRLYTYKEGILSLITAFAAAMILMPLLIKIINRFQWYDVPDKRKDHSVPIPTMGGIVIFLSMVLACVFWFPFTKGIYPISFFFSLLVLFVIGILDDLRDMPAYYKLVLQLGVALLLAYSGIRISNFNGLLGIYGLPLAAQYLLTIVVIAAITNAFNLIDGIDGLAAGLGFMSLVVLGIFLILSKDTSSALVAFALAGGLLGFLYYNFNPARIFMGDTGSLVLGFAIAVLCIRLIGLNTGTPNPVLTNAPVFAVSVVLIPIYDTLRVFTLRLSKGRSPFHPDRTHIHHLLTNNGWSHAFSAKLICTVHGGLLLLGFFLSALPQEAGMLLLLATMLLVTVFFKKLRLSAKGSKGLLVD
jgi:UDP-GlcNAc:undecaprenyl-phosphate/decaprenyl-phosphate GlcNAc-1-phosphate transferase